MKWCYNYVCNCVVCNIICGTAIFAANKEMGKLSDSKTQYSVACSARSMLGLEKIEVLYNSDVSKVSDDVANSFVGLHLASSLDFYISGVCLSWNVNASGQYGGWGGTNSRPYLVDNLGNKEYVAKVNGSTIYLLSSDIRLGFRISICDLHRTYGTVFLLAGYETDWIQATSMDTDDVTDVSDPDLAIGSKEAFRVFKSHIASHFVGVGLRLGAGSSASNMMPGMFVEGYMGAMLVPYDYNIKHFVLTVARPNVGSNQVVCIKTPSMIALGAKLSMSGSLSRNISAGWFVAVDSRLRGQWDSGSQNIVLDKVNADDTLVSDVIIAAIKNSVVRIQSLSYYRMHVGISLSIDVH